MKRLSLVFRNQTEGNSLRINLNDPVDPIDSAALQSDAQLLIDNGLIPLDMFLMKQRLLKQTQMYF